MQPCPPVIVLVLGLFSIGVLSAAYEIPAPIITIFDIGFQISIEDDPGLELMVFHGRINKHLRGTEPGELHGEVSSRAEVQNGRWTYRNRNKQLIIGDVIHYWIYVQHNRLGYRLEDQKFTVRAYDREVQPMIVHKNDSLPPPPRCDLSMTTVNGGLSKCRNEVIFEDEFSTLDLDKWSPLVRFVDETESNEFCSYQNRPESHFIRNGILVIKPELQHELPGFTEHRLRRGELDFGVNCTEDSPFRNNVRDCKRIGEASYIIPPVASARLRTRSSFRFRYGTIEVRAKLPKGDWIFPEILLESYSRPYGPHSFQSGQMRIAHARGNEMLVAANAEDIGGSLLNANLILSNQQEDRGKWQKSKRMVGHWGNEFHTYSLKWTEDKISMSVDGLEYASFADPLCTTEKCQSILNAPKWNEKLSPFNDEFFITLGVGVGGLGDFPDGLTSGPNKIPKPWSNTDPRSELKFFFDRANWHSTWTDDSTLQIDHIKVKSL